MTSLRDIRAAVAEIRGLLVETAGAARSLQRYDDTDALTLFTLPV